MRDYDQGSDTSAANSIADQGAPGRRTLTQRLPVQRKLQVGSANDALEHEADAAADAIIAGGQASAISSASGAAQAKGDAEGMDTGLVEQTVSAGGGGPLPGTTRSKLEAGFGHDLGDVRVHDGGAPATAAASINAQAFTVGNDIYMGAGAYNPGTERGDHLIAHEVAHTIQQGGGVQRKLIQREPEAGKPDPAAGPAAGGDIEATIRKIEHAYSWIVLKQRDAVADLQKDAEKEDPPPFWQTLLIVAAEIALAAALGGVGGLIAGVVAKKIAGKVADLTAKAIADAVKDGAKEAAKKGVKGVIGAIGGSNSVESYWRGMRDTLTDTARAQQSAFIDQEQALRSAPNAGLQAQALHEAIEEQYDNAYAIQRDKALDEWCVYQSKGELGSVKNSKGDDKGTDLNKQVGDTSAKGVLGIVLERVARPRDTPVIARAEIEGLNEQLRKRIEARPIKDIKVAKTVKGEVGMDIGWAAKYIEHKDQPTIAMGQNEQGVNWLDSNGSNRNGLLWLYARQQEGDELWGPGGPSGSALQAGAFKGANLLLNTDMAGLTVAGKLSG